LISGNPWTFEWDAEIHNQNLCGHNAIEESVSVVNDRRSNRESPMTLYVLS